MDDVLAVARRPLGSLGQSMNDEIPLPMALRLRTNAISLEERRRPRAVQWRRMVEHNRRLRKQNQDGKGKERAESANRTKPSPRAYESRVRTPLHAIIGFTE